MYTEDSWILVTAIFLDVWISSFYWNATKIDFREDAHPNQTFLVWYKGKWKRALTNWIFKCSQRPHMLLNVLHNQPCSGHKIKKQQYFSNPISMFLPLILLQHSAESLLIFSWKLSCFLSSMPFWYFQWQKWDLHESEEFDLVSLIFFK